MKSQKNHLKLTNIYSAAVGFIITLFIMIAVMPAADVWAFTARTSAPSTSSAYWYNSSYNPYYSSYKGQCTWYVWGRAYEITGTRPTYTPGSGGAIYSYAVSAGYSHGSTPKVGSIMCTSGHVAVVESISGDSMVVSEYNWDVSLGFSTKTLSVSSSSAGSARGSQTIQGYIYLIDDNSAPVGNLDQITAGTGTLYVRGWAYDPDSSSASIEVHVYIGSYGVNIGAANVERSDVNSTFGISGNHGFDYTIDLTDTGISGSQTVYIYAIDTGGGSNTLIAEKTVTITENHSPTGYLDSISAEINTLKVIGWAYDPDSSGSSVEVHVYIGSYGVNIGAANAERKDVNNAFGISGNHGFNYTIDLTDTGISGSQTVYVYALDLNGVKNTLIAEETVTIPENTPPVGYLDSITAGTGTLKVVGWAYDPDSSSASIEVHVYIGSYGVNIGAANVERKDVNNKYSISGNHGFEYTIDLTDTGISGSQTVDIYAIDTNGGGNTLIAEKTVTITENSSPEAYLDSAEGYAGSLYVKGWAYDPDTTSTSVRIDVYIGGEAGSGGTKVYQAKTNTTRTDVNNKFSISGTHGFEFTIDLTDTSISGSQKVYVYAIDTSGVKNSLSEKSPKTVTISSPYTISYNANGGSGAPSSQSKAYNIALTLSSTVPTRTGYTFSSWNTKADGSGTSYSKGAKYSANSSATLYAVWAPIPGDINIDGKADKTDAALLLKYLSGTADLTDTQLERADYNSDGKINLADASAILKNS